MKRNFKKGQSLLEYTLLLAMVIALILFVLFSGSGIEPKMKATYNKVGTAIDNVNTTISEGIFKTN